MSPVSATLLPPLNTGLSATRALPSFVYESKAASSVPTLAQRSAQVSLSGMGRTLSALSDARVSIAGLQDLTPATLITPAALTRDRVTAFADALNRFTQSLAISAGSDDFEANEVQLPELSVLSNVLLQSGRVPAPSATLDSIGIRFGANGNMDIDPAQFSRALAQHPLRTLGLLADASTQINALGGAASNTPLPLQTARAIRSFLEIAAL